MVNSIKKPTHSLTLANTNPIKPIMKTIFFNITKSITTMNGSYICDHDQFNKTKDQFVNLFTMNKKNKKKKKDYCAITRAAIVHLNNMVYFFINYCNSIQMIIT